MEMKTIGCQIQGGYRKTRDMGDGKGTCRENSYRSGLKRYTSDLFESTARRRNGSQANNRDNKEITDAVGETKRQVVNHRNEAAEMVVVEVQHARLTFSGSFIRNLSY